MYEKYTNIKIPKGKIIRHLCNNTLCINPTHLLIGTPQDNMDDMIKSGNSLKGEKNPKAKLTFQKVKEILTEQISSSKLAEEYGISARQIRNIRSHKSWA